MTAHKRHCEEQRDEAIQNGASALELVSLARKDGAARKIALAISMPGAFHAGKSDN